MNPTSILKMRSWPMWAQVFLAWFLVSTVTVVATSVWIERFETAEFKRDLQLQSEAKLELLESALLDAVITEDIPVLEGVVSKLGLKDVDLAAIWIKNEQGTMLVEQTREDLPGRKDALYLKTEFTLEGETFGCIELLWDLRNFHRRLTGHRYEVGLLISACLTVSAVIFFLLLNGLVLTPLNRVNRRLKGISRGELGDRLSLHTSREVHRLSGSINQLCEVLSSQKSTSDQLIETERQLRETQHRLIDAIETVPDAFVLYDADDRLVVCNERYRQIYAASADLIRTGASFEEIIREGARRGQYREALGREEEWLAERMDLHLNPRGPVVQHLDDGRWVRVEERRTEEGGVVGFRADITELKLQEEELRAARDKAQEANRAKAGFLAMMSHEIRTPLNGVLGILGLLRETELDQRQQRYVQTARESGEALSTVINDVLDFSKMEAGKLEFESSAIDPRQLLDSVYLLFRPRARSKGLQLEVSHSGELPPAFMGDPGRIRQVLLNLVSNAVKFTSAGGVIIAIKGSDAEGGRSRLLFDITDTGIGIAEDKQQGLFEEFATLDASYSRRYGGTGLGLSICRQLVELMGGRIGVESQPELGSRFWFELIVEQAQLPQRDVKIQDTANRPAGQLRAARILLAEDVLANRLVARSILESAGHRVDVAANGAEAVEAVQAWPYDLVLMDISMPEMDGLQATAAIRQLEEIGDKLPIIAMTAHAMVGDKENFLDAGMDDYLTKPVNRDELLQIVTQWSGCLGTVSQADVQKQKDAASQQTPAEGRSADSGSDDDTQGITTAPDPVAVIDADATVPESAGAAVECLLSSAPGCGLYQGYVDTTVLDQMAADTDPALVPELLEVFLADAEKRVQRIRGAAGQHDSEMLMMESHALGSSAGTYGLPQILQLARSLETACREGADKQLPPLSDQLLEHAPLALAALQEYRRLLLRQLPENVSIHD